MALADMGSSIIPPPPDVLGYQKTDKPENYQVDVTGSSLENVGSYDKQVEEKPDTTWMDTNKYDTTSTKINIPESSGGNVQAPISGSFQLPDYGTAATVSGTQGPQFDTDTQAAMNRNQAGAEANVLLRELIEQATGKSTQATAAQAQLRSATDQALQAQQAAAAAARGQFNPAVARQLQQQAALATQGAANQSAQLRAQEQQAAAQTAAGLGVQLSGQNVETILKQQDIATRVEEGNRDETNKMTMNNTSLRQDALIKEKTAGIDVEKWNDAAKQEWEKFKVGQEVDVTKLDAQQKHEMMKIKFAAKAQAEKDYWDARRLALKDDAALKFEQDKWQALEANKTALEVKKLKAGLAAGDQASMAKWQAIYDDFATEQRNAGIEEERIKQNWTIENNKLNQQIKEYEEGKPTTFEKGLGYAASLTGIFGTGIKAFTDIKKL